MIFFLQRIQIKKKLRGEGGGGGGGGGGSEEVGFFLLRIQI